MCGIIGLLLADEDAHVNQMLFDGLTVLQHRGQDAAGIVTSDNQSNRLHLRKDNGLVAQVFGQHHMVELIGHMGIGHCRYPTAGSSCTAEAQPFYTNYPYGICVAHNGNITNTEELASHLRQRVGRHVNTDSDSELLLNLFAEYLTQYNNAHNTPNSTTTNMKDAVFDAMSRVMSQTKGGYAGLFLINGVGLVGFRDPHGIRPIVFGCRRSRTKKKKDAESFDEDGVPQTPTGGSMGTADDGALDYVISSESVAIDTLGFTLIRDLKAGEVIFIDTGGSVHTRVCHERAKLSPCIFEYVYFARPDSIMDGCSVYETRLKMGEKLAHAITRKHPECCSTAATTNGGAGAGAAASSTAASGNAHPKIDVVIPIPDTSRTCALQAAYCLNIPFREGFIKNRYIARTFIMPGQATRVKSVRLKLNTIKSEFVGKNVLLVDDSIVRGTTASEIVQMARDAGALSVYFCSAAPPIRYPNIYGIDIPTRHELIAYERDEREIAAKIGCDWVVYQELSDLEDSIREVSAEKKQLLFRLQQQRQAINGGNNVPPSPTTTTSTKHVVLGEFDTSCFSGTYVTGQKIDDAYFNRLHDLRNDDAKKKKRRLSSSLTADNGDKNGGEDDNGNHDGSGTKTTQKGLQKPPQRRSSSGSLKQTGLTTTISNQNLSCEPMSNDTHHSNISDTSCEPISNQ